METRYRGKVLLHIIRLETFLRGMETLLSDRARCDDRSLETFLRGMETSVRGAWRRRLECPLETFLRGMETKVRIGHPGHGPALKPSLEGWKPSARSFPHSSTSGLETFLRGMETGVYIRFMLLLSLLETFLRGMETVIELPPSSGFGNLETFLRGMETSRITTS